MKRSWARKLVADLKTNPPKGKGALRKNRGYCCLGRLALLAGYKFPVACIDKEVSDKPFYKLHDADGKIVYEEDIYYKGTLPPSLKKAVGLTDEEESQLMHANDSKYTVDWKPVLKVLRDWT